MEMHSGNLMWIKLAKGATRREKVQEMPLERQAGAGTSRTKN